MNDRTKLYIALAIAPIAVFALWRIFGGNTEVPVPSTTASPWGDAARNTAIESITPSAPPAIVSASPVASASSRALAADVRASAKWGSGNGALGRARESEGNAEGPMSFALAGDHLVVLDQVNGRVVRYGKDGRVISTTDTPTTTQDVAVAADGTTVLLDRLAGKTITLKDASGRRVGELPLSDPRIGDPGLLTGVFVDGKDVYVEKGHGALVKVGTSDGTATPEGEQITGRPSKDGVLVVTAGFASQPTGKAWLNAFDRKKGALRFARVIQFPAPGRTIVLLDTDLKGTIYVGAWAGPGNEATIACLDATDGHPLGRVTVAVSATPDESLRDFAVGADGTIVYALRSDEGVDYRTARCP